MYVYSNVVYIFALSIIFSSESCLRLNIIKSCARCQYQLEINKKIPRASACAIQSKYIFVCPTVVQVLREK